MVDNIANQTNVVNNVTKQPNMDSDATTQNLLNAYKNNEIMADILPIINSLSNNSSLNPAELFNTLFKIMRSILVPIQALEDLADTPVIGTLVNVLIEIFSMVMKIYAFLITLHLMHFKGIPFGYDDTVKLIDELNKSDLLKNILQLKQEIHKTADANNPQLTTMNNTSAQTSELAINEITAITEGLKEFTLDKFLDDNEATLGLLGIERLFLDNGNDPFYLQLNPFNAIQEQLNEAIVQTVRKRQTETSEAFMTQTVQNVIDKTK